MTVFKKLKNALKFKVSSWKYYDISRRPYYLYKGNHDIFKIIEINSHISYQKIAPFSINLIDPVINFRGTLSFKHKSNVEFMPIKTHGDSLIYTTNHLDKDRFVLVYPDIISYERNGYNFFLNYYIKNSLTYLLENMIIHAWIEATYSTSEDKKIALRSFNNNILKNIPIFSSNTEKNKFIKWLKQDYSTKELNKLISIYKKRCNTEKIKRQYPYFAKYISGAQEENAFTKACKDIYTNNFPK